MIDSPPPHGAENRGDFGCPGKPNTKAIRKIQVHGRPSEGGCSAHFHKRSLVVSQVFRLIEMYQFISEREDDQIAMGEYFCTRPWRLAVDFDRQFVYNHQYKLVEDPNNAYFIHFPGYFMLVFCVCIVLCCVFCF